MGHANDELERGHRRLSLPLPAWRPPQLVCAGATSPRSVGAPRRARPSPPNLLTSSWILEGREPLRDSAARATTGPDVGGALHSCLWYRFGALCLRKLTQIIKNFVHIQNCPKCVQLLSVMSMICPLQIQSFFHNFLNSVRMSTICLYL